MKLIQEHKTTVIIGTITALLGILIIISQSIGEKPPSVEIKKDVIISQKSFQTVEVLPTLPSTQGGGLNENAPEIKTSTQEIEKLVSKLPFRATVQRPNLPEAHIGIPAAKNFDNNWTLIVYVEADYQSPPETAEYETNKKVFIEAAKIVHDWIVAQNADPEKIYLQWGDDELSQQRAREWLQ